MSKPLCEGFTNCSTLGFLLYVKQEFPKILFVGIVSLSKYAGLQSHLTSQNKGVLLFFGIPTGAKKSKIRVSYSSVAGGRELVELCPDAIPTHNTSNGVNIVMFSLEHQQRRKTLI